MRFVSDMLDDDCILGRFEAGSPLPPYYGVGLDERVVEFPWVFSCRPSGRVLDAGSSFNHSHILERLLSRIASLEIVTLAPEAQSFSNRAISYVYADLRELPCGDGSFDTVVSISTLEHVGMDNSRYGSRDQPSSDPDLELRRALGELMRVLSPSGTLLLTIPYGRREDHGWFRQFDRDGLEDLVDFLGPGSAQVSVYGYTRDGWQISEAAASADAVYRDFLANPTPVDDGAAAARAVACIRAKHRT